jgi:hypothetical protein
MPTFLIAIIGIVIAVGMLLWGGGLADAVDYEPEAFVAVGRTKRSTLVFIALTFAVGGFWYWAFIRTPVRRAALELEARSAALQDPRSAPPGRD